MNEMKSGAMTITNIPAAGNIPPVLRDIAGHIAEHFELATEFGCFKNDEDEDVIELMMQLYFDGKCVEAIAVLRLAFSLIECSEALELLSLVHGENGTDMERQFIEAFVEQSPRINVRKIKVMIEEVNMEGN